MEGTKIDDQIIGWEEVKRITGKSRSTILRYMEAGAFPLRVTDNHGHIYGWRLSEVMSLVGSLKSMSIDS